MKLSAFVNANVLFSAADPTSASANLLRAAAPVIDLVTCDYAVSEATSNVRRKTPGTEPELLAVVRRLEVVPTSDFHLPAPLASKDVPILCSAAASGCDLLVTGDFNDFRHLFGRTVHGVRVVRPAEFAAVIAAVRSQP